ncbi:MAG TPA: hypothetical protein VFO40_21220 [Chthoniobacterales bacterium]|nr:hypothetical protein [Chthoniobacterales bacterium]
MSNLKQRRTDPAMVALIAAIIDPDEIRKTEPTNEIPNSLLAAIDLVEKAQKLIDGAFTLEQLRPEWKERFRLTGVLDKLNKRDAKLSSRDGIANRLLPSRETRDSRA